MNYVQFSGKVASVNAYTDGSHAVLDGKHSCSWTVTDDYYRCTLVNINQDEDNWISVRFPKKIFNEFFESHKPETITFMGVCGVLKTRIGIGSGYVDNFIEVKRIAKYCSEFHLTK